MRFFNRTIEFLRRILHRKIPKRDSLNAPGDFYVEDGVCMTCMAPHQEAPQCMGFDESRNHCFIRKQPSTDEEVDRAIRAVFSSCIGAIRYGGNDSKILRRLGEMGAWDRCDNTLPEPIQEKVRPFATFHYKTGDSNSARELLEMLKRFLVRPENDLSTSIEEMASGWSFLYRWWRDVEGVTVTVKSVDGKEPRLLLSIGGPTTQAYSSTSIRLDDFIKQNAECSSVRWYTAQEWESGGLVWQVLPY